MGGHRLPSDRDLKDRPPGPQACASTNSIAMRRHGGRRHQGRFASPFGGPSRAPPSRDQPLLPSSLSPGPERDGLHRYLARSDRDLKDRLPSALTAGREGMLAGALGAGEARVARIPSPATAPASTPSRSADLCVDECAGTDATATRVGLRPFGGPSRAPPKPRSTTPFLPPSPRARKDGLHQYLAPKRS